MSKEIGRKIKIMRQSKHISQNELAKKASIAQSTLSYIESGKKNPQFDTLSAVCRALETTILDLLTYEEQKNQSRKFKENSDMAKLVEKKLSFRSLLPPDAMEELFEFEKYLYQKYKHEQAQ